MKYGLIGEKLSHSFSKEIHESIAPYKYELLELSPSELSDFLSKKSFCAINVTIPYKAAVIPFLDEISDEAKELGAVNVIVNKNGRLFGYNTDYLGMKDMIRRSGIVIKDKKVLILGTGATSRTAALVAKDLGAKEIAFVSRNEKKGVCTYENAYKEHSDAQIIINTTPVGTYPNSYEAPIDTEGFESLDAVFDAVYNPLRTFLVSGARGNKVYGEAGLYMLVSQAVHAIALFTGEELPSDTTSKTYDKIVKEKENIVLVGMPSCGKTTVGKALSKELSREFFDLDYEIEKYIGCTIAEYFETHSERDFREIETKITKDVSQKSGIIIATGGGCVMKSENVKALRSNGRLYFIDRSLKRLTPTHSRPLARRPGDIENLYKLRYQVYVNVSDVKTDGNAEPDAIAKNIIKEFYQER